MGAGWHETISSEGGVYSERQKLGRDDKTTAAETDATIVS